MSYKPLTIEEAAERYGHTENGSWTLEQAWCSNIVIPQGINMKNSIGTRQKHIYCNKDMQEPLLKTLNDIEEAGLAELLETFDGCFMVRDVRGELGKPSAHSYGLAIDVNAAMNPLRAIPTISAAIVSCFKANGFDWGGDFTRLDGMHFSYCWEGKK